MKNNIFPPARSSSGSKSTKTMVVTLMSFGFTRWERQWSFGSIKPSSGRESTSTSPLQPGAQQAFPIKGWNLGGEERAAPKSKNDLKCEHEVRQFISRHPVAACVLCGHSLTLSLYYNLQESFLILGENVVNLHPGFSATCFSESSLQLPLQSALND